MEVWPAMSKYNECQENLIKSFKIKVTALYRSIIEATFLLQKAITQKMCS